jgi:hypothetical protein
MKTCRNIVGLDLPLELDEFLTRTAAELGVPVSQLARRLLITGIEHSTMDELVAARQPRRDARGRYEYELYRDCAPQPITLNRVNPKPLKQPSKHSM